MSRDGPAAPNTTMTEAAIVSLSWPLVACRRRTLPRVEFSNPFAFNGLVCPVRAGREAIPHAGGGAADQAAVHPAAGPAAGWAWLKRHWAFWQLDSPTGLTARGKRAVGSVAAVTRPIVAGVRNAQGSHWVRRSIPRFIGDQKRV